MCDIRKKTIQVLTELKAPKANLGFAYILDAVEIAGENIKNIEFIGEVYEKIAKKHKSTYARVERAIRHEISTIIVKADDDVKKRILNETRHIVNKEFIATIYYYIQGMEEVA